LPLGLTLGYDGLVHFWTLVPCKRLKKAENFVVIIA